MDRLRFAPPRPSPPGFARRVPPAVFAPLSGLFGVGLALRAVSGASGLAAATGEVLLGATTFVLIFAAGSYLVKLWRRPGVLRDDLRVIPGRVGIASAILCFYLLPETLAPHLPGLARGLLLVALALHAGFLVLLALAFAGGPVEQRRYAPTGQIYFASPAVAAAAAGALGLTDLGTALFWISLAAALFLWLLGALTLWGRRIAPALRPLLALHLLPAPALGLAAFRLDYLPLAEVLALWTTALILLLMVLARWLTAGGFSMFWSAFSYPVATAAAFWLTLGPPWRAPGLVLLPVAVAIALTVAYRVLKLWATGQLAVRTNAASA